MQIELADKLYYSIGEVATAFQVNVSLIRFWETEFDLLQPKKNKNGNRLFSPKDIETLKTIYHLVKERGYTLDGAKKALASESTVKDIELIFRLGSIRSELLALKHQFDVD